MMFSKETDEQLLRRFTSGGERAAMDELIRRHIDLVYAAARRQLGGDEYLAADVTQAVFMLLLSKARSVRQGRVAGWLLQTTRYASANARKVARRRIHHEHEAAAQRKEATVSAGEHPLLANLDRGIAALRPAEREVVALRYLEGREMEAVCSVLGTSEAACRKRLNRAMRRLEKLITEKGTAAIGEVGVVALLRSASMDKAPVPVHAAVSAGTSAAGVSEILRETAMQLMWMKVKAIGFAAVVCGAILLGAGDIARLAYGEKPATNPSVMAGSQQSTALPSTQPQEPPADLHREQLVLLDIGSAVNTYAYRHGGRLPDSLGQTLQYIERRSEWTKDSRRKATAAEKGGLYLSPADSLKKAVPSNPTPKWVDENTSFVYLLNGAKVSDFPDADWGKMVVAHGKLDEGFVVIGADKKPVTVICVLMLDGHVESETRASVEAAIADTKKRLAGENGGL